MTRNLSKRALSVLTKQYPSLSSRFTFKIISYSQWKSISARESVKFREFAREPIIPHPSELL